MLKKSTLLSTVIICMALALTSCAKRVDTHGNVIKQSQLDKIEIGEHSQRDVAALLGSPTATGTFNNKRWYYFTEKSAVESLGERSLLEREIVIIDFNNQGIATAMTFKDQDDSKAVTPDKATTETHGQTMGIIDQFIDNLSRGL